MAEITERTRTSMKVVSLSLVFLNIFAFILMIFIYGKNDLDFFWGGVGHFVYLGSVLVADTLFSVIVYILPQNWSQSE